MEWDRYSTRRRHSHHGSYLLPALLVFGMAIVFTHSIMPFLPILIVLFVILPMMRGGREYSAAKRQDDFEKPKRDFQEKPKREPRYVMGDDGEMLEVIEEQQPTEADDDATLYA